MATFSARERGFPAGENSRRSPPVNSRRGGRLLAESGSETCPTRGRAVLDPDRFFDFRKPGAQEWWYFDAISDDGRDAIVLVWYAALPFDPDYGVAALRHLANPSRNPSPRGL